MTRFVQASRRAIAAGLAAAMMAVLPVGLAGIASIAPATSALAQAALEKLVIVTAKGPQPFEVEVMRTDEERAKGLMFRRYLPPDRGMLFDFKQTQPVMMWMKDTFIPLDMVFIRKDGTVSSVAENTEPHSTRTIASTEPVYAVLEVNAGTAARLGIKTGDRVQHALFPAR
jgi:uncharacterized membrane protein (UPF0127 family)